MRLSFPKNFFWGASISSHQTEGNTKNDWSAWELKNAQRLAMKTGGNINDHISGLACDHYNRYETDLDLAEALNFNAFRFSLEWSRIEPKKGYFDDNEIEHYKNYIHSLKERGLEPFLTLWHYTNPIWFAEEGGWSSKKAVSYFQKYVARVIDEFKDDVKYIITINEPEAFSFLHSYFGPPEKRNPLSFLSTYSNLLSAHKSAYKYIKSVKESLQVGASLNISHMDTRFFLKPLKVIGNKINYAYINSIRKYQDFIGLNYYFQFTLGLEDLEESCESDMGWKLRPAGLYHVLKSLKKYDKPVFITEHGLADSKDEYRTWYIKESLKYVYKAMKEGVDIRGYLHWSLLDNFEWEAGFSPRFGLIEVDYGTLERRVRNSAIEYSEICKNNFLEI